MTTSLKYLQLVRDVRKLNSEEDGSLMKLLPPKYRPSRNSKVPNESGIGPVHLLFARSIIISLEAFEIVGAILPLRSFDPR